MGTTRSQKIPPTIIEAPIAEVTSTTQQTNGKEGDPPNEYSVEAMRDPAAFLLKHGHRLMGQPTTHTRALVAYLIADGKALGSVVKEHSAKLLAVGIEPRFLEELPLRIAIAEAAQTVRAMTFVAQSAAEAQAVKEALDHRTAMTKTARYALRRDPDAQRVLDRIAERNSNADLSEDLRSLCEVFRANSPSIAKTGRDPSAMIELAIQREGELTSTTGRRAIRVKGGTREVQQRNQAMHHALEAIREVRDAGLFALEGDEKLEITLRGLASLSHKARRSGATANGSMAEGNEGGSTPATE